MGRRKFEMVYDRKFAGGTVTVCGELSGVSRGLGSVSCGPEFLEKYRLAEKRLTFESTFFLLFITYTADWEL